MSREREPGLSTIEEISFPALFLAVISSICFICDFGSDLATAAVLQAQNRFIECYFTLVFAILPMIIVNILSITIYTRKSDKNKTGKIIWFIRIASHFLQFGAFQRRLETIGRGLIYFTKRRNASYERKFLKTTAFQSYIYHSQCLVYLNLIQCFLHDLPQLLLQTYLWITDANIYHHSGRHAVKCNALCKTLLTSMAFSVVSLTIAIVNYHQNKRYALQIRENRILKDQSLSDYIFEFIWRSSTTGSRIFVVSLALANLSMNSSLTYMAILTFHWLIYTIHFKNTNKEIRANDFTLPTHAALAGGRDWFLGIVHVFCFFDDQRKFSKWSNRLKTFYYLEFMEDSIFLLYWHFQYVGFNEVAIIRPWIFQVAALIYFVSFFGGVSAMVLYFHARKQPLSLSKEKRYSKKILDSF